MGRRLVIVLLLLASFPVEHHPLENPDLKLIERSARELAALADEERWPWVVLPRPGTRTRPA